MVEIRAIRRLLVAIAISFVPKVAEAGPVTDPRALPCDIAASSATKPPCFAWVSVPTSGKWDASAGYGPASINNSSFYQGRRVWGNMTSAPGRISGRAGVVGATTTLDGAYIEYWRTLPGSLPPWWLNKMSINATFAPIGPLNKIISKVDFYVSRHGESFWPVNGTWCSRTSPMLKCKWFSMTMEHNGSSLYVTKSDVAEPSFVSYALYATNYGNMQNFEEWETWTPPNYNVTFIFRTIASIDAAVPQTAEAAIDFSNIRRNYSLIVQHRSLLSCRRADTTTPTPTGAGRP
jgi:hypothetical protein